LPALLTAAKPSPKDNQRDFEPPDKIAAQLFSFALVARSSIRADLHSGEISVRWDLRQVNNAPFPRSTLAQNFWRSAAQAVRIFARASLSAGERAAGVGVAAGGAVL
jgi:hypothetical protein